MVDFMLAELFLLNSVQSLTLENQNADNIMRDNVTVSLYLYLSTNVFLGGGYCNFMHPKHVSRDLKRQLFK